MAIEKIPTFCRVCEAACGLVAEKENDVILRLRPDKSHPVSKGFACHKGIFALEMHHDEDRLNFPLKRTNPRHAFPGEFEKQTWDASVSDIAEKTKHIIHKYGNSALGAFIGNPTAFNSLLTPAINSFCFQTGCGKIFTSGTQDCTNKFAAGEAIFGTSTLHPIPDIEHTDYLLIIGENPKISHMSFLSIADPMTKLRGAKKKGKKTVFINPRVIESSGVKT